MLLRKQSVVVVALETSLSHRHPKAILHFFLPCAIQRAGAKSRRLSFAISQTRVAAIKKKKKKAFPGPQGSNCCNSQRNLSPFPAHLLVRKSNGQSFPLFLFSLAQSSVSWWRNFARPGESHWRNLLTGKKISLCKRGSLSFLSPFPSFLLSWPKMTSTQPTSTSYWPPGKSSTDVLLSPLFTSSWCSQPRVAAF